MVCSWLGKVPWSLAKNLPGAQRLGVRGFHPAGSWYLRGWSECREGRWSWARVGSTSLEEWLGDLRVFSLEKKKLR